MASKSCSYLIDILCEPDVHLILLFIFQMIWQNSKVFLSIILHSVNWQFFLICQLIRLLFRVEFFLFLSEISNSVLIPILEYVRLKRAISLSLKLEKEHFKLQIDDWGHLRNWALSPNPNASFCLILTLHIKIRKFSLHPLF